MSSFTKFFETIQGRFPSDTSRYFAKPLLAEAYKQGATDEAAKRSKRGQGKLAKISGGDIIASGRSGASSANE